jgi:hypothetical protein
MHNTSMLGMLCVEVSYMTWSSSEAMPARYKYKRNWLLMNVGLGV